MRNRLKGKVTPPLLCCVVIALTAGARGACAQTLNDATTAQLAKTDVPTENNKPCGLLLGDDDRLDALLDGGNLQQSICARGNAPATDPSTGGGPAATPPSRPVAVEARL